MFQIALTLREVLLVGRTAPVRVSGSMKPSMPCFCGLLPVAMEFHSIGERLGSRVARFPMTPLLMRLFRVGMRPWSSRGVMAFQSAASQPMSRILLASGSLTLMSSVLD